MRASATLVIAVALASCSGRGAPSLSNRAEPPGAPASTSCYPYERRDGVCLLKCDWYSPRPHQGCATAEWPLLCNKDGTCTPEMRHDR
ncbi:MAG: hypothetical protein ACKV2T_25935 [Kofleriaceae bacterium]